MWDVFLFCGCFLGEEPGVEILLRNGRDFRSSGWATRRRRVGLQLGRALSEGELLRSEGCEIVWRGGGGQKNWVRLNLVIYYLGLVDECSCLQVCKDC